MVLGELRNASRKVLAKAGIPPGRWAGSRPRRRPTPAPTASSGPPGRCWTPRPKPYGPAPWTARCRPGSGRCCAWPAARWPMPPRQRAGSCPPPNRYWRGRGCRRCRTECPEHQTGRRRPGGPKPASASRPATVPAPSCSPPEPPARPARSSSATPRWCAGADAWTACWPALPQRTLSYLLGVPNRMLRVPGDLAARPWHPEAT